MSVGRRLTRCSFGPGVQTCALPISSGWVISGWEKIMMSLVIFLLIELMPGDPIDIMIFSSPEMTQAEAERLRALYGLDRPILERYLAWLGNALSGDFGY